MYIPDDYTQNYPSCRLKLLVETFGHLTWWTNQSKSIKSPIAIKQIYIFNPYLIKCLYI